MRALVDGALITGSLVSLQRYQGAVDHAVVALLIAAVQFQRNAPAGSADGSDPGLIQEFP
jgi:hypothetical protein